MATIPLPALHVNTEQQSPLAMYAQLQQIRNAQQQQQLVSTETQQKQLQLKDTQATTAAMKEWDGKNPDDLPPLILKNGGSSTAVFGLKNQILDWKTKAANLNKDQLDNLDKTNNIIAGHFESVKGAKPEDKAGVYTSAIQDLQDKGLAKPGQFPEQYPGDDVIDMWEKQHMGQKAIVEQAQKDKEIQQKQQTLDIEKTKLAQTQPGGALENPEQKYIRLQSQQGQGQPLSDADKTWVAGYEKNKKMVPLLSGQLRVEGQGKIRQFPVYDNNTKQTVYMDSNEINDAKLREPGRYTVPQYTPEAEIAKGTGTAFAPGGKAGQELKAFNTAFQHADLLSNAAKALDNGDTKALNTVKNSLKTQFGSADVTNFDTIAQVYNHEVLKALGGHITDAEVKSANAMIPDNASPAQIKGALDNLKAMMQSKIGVLKKQYEEGKKGEPGFGDAGGTKKVLSPAEWLEQQKKP